MSSAALFLIDGFEEMEAVTTADILRRGGVTVNLISLTDRLEVQGKHGMVLKAEYLFDQGPGQVDMLIVPGGTLAFLEHRGLAESLQKHQAAGKPLAAICAAPAFFGTLGLLQGKKAVCYPGLENRLSGALVGQEPVITDGLITTSRGPATAIPFALRLLKILAGPQTAETVRRDILAPQVA